jgi:hypothetical protein
MYQPCLLLLFGSMAADVLKPNSRVVNIHPIQQQAVAFLLHNNGVEMLQQQG